MQIRNNYSIIPKRLNPEEVLNPPEIIPIVTPYDNFHSVLNRKWCLVSRKNPILKNTRIIAAYKRHKNLGDLLVSERLTKNLNKNPTNTPYKNSNLLSPNNNNNNNITNSPETLNQTLNVSGTKEPCISVQPEF